MTRILSEQEKVRRESLQKLRELGIEPYPAEMFDVNITSKQIKDNKSLVYQILEAIALRKLASMGPILSLNLLRE